jgi:hypothetical protein
MVEAPPELPRMRLVSAWAKVAVVSWVVVMAALIATAVTGRNVGKPAWWIGPESNPTVFVVWLAPFVLPFAVIVLAFRASRFVPLAGVAASIVIAGIAAADISRSPGVALLEGIVAFCGLLIAIATFAGLERR